MLESPRVRDLLNKKWETFGKQMFWRKFLSALVFLALLSASTIWRSSEAHYGPSLRHTVYCIGTQVGGAAYSEFGTANWIGVQGVLGEITNLTLAAYRCACGAGTLELQPLCTCLLALTDFLVFYFAVRKLRIEVSEVFNEGWGYLSGGGAAFIENVCSFLTTTGVVFVVMIRTGILGPAALEWEAFVLSVVVILGWGYMLFFLLGWESTGPIVVMMHKMLLQDIFLFFTIYSVFLTGFTLAFHVQFDDVGLNGFITRAQGSFVTMLGDLNMDLYTDPEKVKNPTLASMLLILYIMVISVMLLNLLIAMMGDTYSKVIEGAKMMRT